ncbi:MAG: discoidin domain-containing protein [Gammaproteobacteria bacterium]|nr:MAG: discoidin domain-containing protein [Gammaproteobacteria bacterium]
MHVPSFFAPVVLPAVVLGVLAGAVAYAEDQTLPPRSQWGASSSSGAQPSMEPALAIDGDESTKWGGAFSPGNWLQVDLSRTATIGGVLIHWDAAFAAAYLILSSEDGQHWQTAFETTDSPGGTDYVLFPAVRARYLRLGSAPRTTDWGVSVFEFEPLAASESPWITGLRKGDHPAALWSAAATGTIVGRAPTSGTRELHLRFPRPLPVSGLEVFWDSARRDARLEGRGVSGPWRLLAEDPVPLGDSSYLAAREPRTVSELRLRVSAAPGHVPAIRRLRLLSPTQALTTMKRYEIVASRAHHELFPSSLHGQQVYWTAVGVPAAHRKSVFDEYGDLEAFKGAPLVQPLWRDSSGRTAAAYEARATNSLRNGWMPMPAVQWSPQPGLELHSEAIAADQAAGPVTFVRHRLVNTGASRVEGQLAIVVRPMQVNPPWQHGGVSPIRLVEIAGTGARSIVNVNGRALLTSLTPAMARGTASFGLHGETEITRYLAEGRVPNRLSARDEEGLAAAALIYNVHLDPGEQRDVVLAFPLGDPPADSASELLGASALNRAEPVDEAKPGAAFDAIARRVERQWQVRFARIGLALPDSSLVDMLRAQVAYMLINQTGPAMQAGPRNYDRSFIRDGSATAAVLLRMGLASTAREYLRWYTDHAVHENGLVSPILNDDGSVNRGFGSDLEYDSQGEFVALVVEVARLDGGAASVREYLPKVRLALEFLQQLRERTLVPGYMGASEAPERFRGIIAPSISHEGYSKPAHSYWDDYWALKGWHDGAWLAHEWGDQEMAAWALTQYAALRNSVASSIRATMQWKAVDYIPASADLGDRDPSSVSIGLDPCGQKDLLPADALSHTFVRYLDEVRERGLPGALYAYTPYEFRNVLTFVQLNRPKDGEELLGRLLTGRRPVQWQVLAEVVRSQARRPFYLGDMPHTWVGAEYARALFGMLLHEEDERLDLLPGVPRSWVAGEGLRISNLPTAFGTLSVSARQEGAVMRVVLEPGLRDNAPLQVDWPARQRPLAVTVDGRSRLDYSAEGIRLERPFRELVAQW